MSLFSRGGDLWLSRNRLKAGHRALDWLFHLFLEEPVLRADWRQLNAQMCLSAARERGRRVWVGAWTFSTRPDQLIKKADRIKTNCKGGDG